jgi:hypothetical protein
MLNPLTLSRRDYLAPEEFQERLTQIGGMNKYDEPNFVIFWGASSSVLQAGDQLAMYRAGASWEVEGIPAYTGYRWNLLGGGQHCWCLAQWHSPIEYGTPEQYYVMNYDVDNDLQTLGEFPYSGRYQLLYSLRYVERRGSGLHTEVMPLNAYLLDTIVPIILQAKSIGWEKTKLAMQDMKAREDARDVNKIEDVMRDKAMPFRYSKVAFNKQGCRTDVIDKKIESMTRNWNQIISNAKSFTKGMQSRTQN